MGSQKSTTDRLVYYELYDEITDLLAREKQVKSWRREKKVELIEKLNPEWKDLAEEWYSNARRK